jgi:hypothetical protein
MKKKQTFEETNEYPIFCHSLSFFKKLFSFFFFSESNAGEFEAVRLDLQQQVVRGHLHHPLPQQEGDDHEDI